MHLPGQYSRPSLGGPAQRRPGKITRVGFQIGPQEDLNEFEKQTQKHGVKTARKKDPEPSISDMLVFEDPKGTAIEVFKRPDFVHQNFPPKASCRTSSVTLPFIART